LCGVSSTLTALMVFRVFVGLGIGGEWSTGVAYISETWPKQYRIRILGVVQSASVIGMICAILVTGVMVSNFGWRSVFYIGAIPGLLALWISWGIPESEVWAKQEKISLGHLFKELFTTSGTNLVVCTLLATLGMIGYWAIQTWIPAYLAMPVAAGGRGLNLMKTTLWMVTIPLGGIVGSIAFGFIAEKIGVKVTFILYFVLAAIVLPLYLTVRNVDVLLYLGPIIGISCSYYAGFAAAFPVMFPTRVRATAQGVAYNVGRAISGLAPAVVGGIALKVGMGNALLAATGIFVVAALFVIVAIPNFKKGLAIE
jgi:predicted MFS family arabinose efflux permease